MTGKRPRYRFVLMEEPEDTLPVRYRRWRPFFPPRPPWLDPLQALFEALSRLNRRGVGEAAWAPALADNPLAFLLDAMGDAVLLRQRDGEMVYANPAARRLGLTDTGPAVSLEILQVQDQSYERRCMTFGLGNKVMVLEVLRRVDRPY